YTKTRYMEKYACTLANTHTHRHMEKYTHKCTYTHKDTHTLIHSQTKICMHTHTHTHTHIYPRTRPADLDPLGSTSLHLWLICTTHNMASVRDLLSTTHQA